MMLEDYVFLAQVLNFSVAMLSTVIIAWSRHGQLENEQELVPSGTIQFIYKMDSDFISVRERADRLTQAEKKVLRLMVENGNSLTFRMAAAYGVKRAHWNKLRFELRSMGLADFGQGGELLVNSAAAEYFQIRER